MKANEKLLLCLCSICANQFYNSSEHIIKRVDPYQAEKKICTYCDVRSGYDYEIIKKKKAKNGVSNVYRK